MKGKVIINAEMCKGCGLCIEVCPKKVLRRSSRNNSLGVYVIEQKKNNACTGCMHCAIICPEAAIEVYRK